MNIRELEEKKWKVQWEIKEKQKKLLRNCGKQLLEKQENIFKIFDTLQDAFQRDVLPMKKKFEKVLDVKRKFKKKVVKMEICNKILEEVKRCLVG